MSPSKSPTMEHPHPMATNSLSPPIKQNQQQFDEAESVEESDHHDEFADEKTRLQKEKEAADANFLKSFPPGYRFNPHDEELVMYYLQKKIKGLPLPPNRIMEVNLYLYNPDTLAERYERYGEKEWYFFTPRDRKYPNGLRPNRAAGDGYWKATGADRPIRSDGLLVGYRKALVFYIGKAPKGNKTNWIMHEFRVSNSLPPVKRTEKDMRLDHWVLCRIYKKVGGKNNKIRCTNHEAEEPEEEEEEIISASSPEDMMKMEEMSSTTQQSYSTNFNHRPMESVHANPNNYHSYHNFGAGELVHSTDVDMAHSNYSHHHHPAVSLLEYLYAGRGRSMCTAPNNNVLDHQTRFHQQFDNIFPTMGQVQFATSSSMDSDFPEQKCEDVHFPDQELTELDDMPSSTHQEQELVDVKDDGQGFQDDLELWNSIEPGLLCSINKKFNA